MAGFSPSTFAILYSKLKKFKSDIKSIKVNPTNDSEIIFELMNGTQFKVTVPNGNVFVNDFSSLPSTGIANRLYICKNDDSVTQNKKGIYLYNSTDSKYEPLYTNEKGIEIIDDYSNLPTVTENTICYVMKDYTDTSVTPNKLYEKGFYLFNKTSSKWDIISSSSDFKLDEWKANEVYTVDDCVYKNLNIYKCIQAHTSTTDFDTDLLTNWKLIVGGKEEYEQWETGKLYNVNDIVIKDGAIYKCIISHTSNDFDTTDIDNWIKLVKEYVILKKSQYDYIETNSLLEDKLYIIVDDTGSTIDMTNKGIEIVQDYSKLPNDKNDYVIDYCLNDYIDTIVTPNVTYGKGYYLYNPTITQWEKISEDVKLKEGTDISIVKDSNGDTVISSTIFLPKYEVGKAYKVGDMFSYEYKDYKVNTDFTATATLDLTNVDLIKLSELHIHAVTKAEYDQMIANGEITADTKDLYIVDGVPATDNTFSFEDWASGEKHEKDKYYVYEYRLYKCLTENTDTDFIDSNYKLIIGYIEPKEPDLVNGTAYNVDDIIEHDNKKYKCIISYTSIGDWDNELDNWIEVDTGYYKLKKTQYEYLNTNNMLEDKLYLVIDA